MIKGFSDRGLAECWNTGACRKIRPDLRERVLRKLEILDAATSLGDVQRTPSCRGVHTLHGNRKGYYALPVNGPWRLVFRCDGGDFYDIALEQYH